MADRFDKFTERARRTLRFAQEESQRFNHDYIGTEHLLLGLVREELGVGAMVIMDLGVRLGDVRSAVESQIGRGEGTPGDKAQLTPQGKKAIELAVAEARRLNHRYIGTEHLLLGIARGGEGVAFGVLESFGITLEKGRAETVRILTEGGPFERRQAMAVAEALTAIDSAIAAIDALGGSDLGADVARGMIHPVLARIRSQFGALTVTNLPVGYTLDVRRQVYGSLLILDEARGVFERHNIGQLADPLTEAAMKVRAALG